MPLYEYQCDACHHRFERIQKFSDPPVDVCPHCGKGPVQKLLSSPAIQFKGSGWYVTDYAKKSTESKDGKPAKDPKDTAGAAGKSGESSAGAESSASPAKPAGAPASAEKKA